MRIIAVDDERLELDNIIFLLKEVLPEAEIHGFLNSTKAFEYLKNNAADIAFLDIEMGEMNGIALAKKCKDICPNINIIFVTGYNQYAMDALRLHVSGYLMKPVRAKDLQIELDNLRHPLPVKPTCRVRVQTFGNFEVFLDNMPIHMPIAKCRECLAYLIDRKGARVTVPELAAVLWEERLFDKTVQNNTHRVISDMMKVLREAGIDNIVIKTRRDISINIDEVDCDYYCFLKGDVSQINTFHGEYMTNYSWAEFTLAHLIQSKKYIKWGKDARQDR